MLGERITNRSLALVPQVSTAKQSKWGFPKFRGTFLGVPIIRIIIYWGLYWVPLVLGNYQMKTCECVCGRSKQINAYHLIVVLVRRLKSAAILYACMSQSPARPPLIYALFPAGGVGGG